MNAIKNDYQVICEAGREAAKHIDEGRYIIGDLACLVEKQWSEDRIGQFAIEINVEKSRVQEYRRVCAFYEKSARAQYLAENDMITFSHLRRAMHLKTEDRAYKLLNKASMRGWTVRQLDRFLARYKRLFEGYKPPEKPVECSATVVDKGDTPETRDYITLKAPIMAIQLQPGQVIRVLVYVEDLK